MRKIKGMLSLVLILAVLCSSFSFMSTVSVVAADTDKLATGTTDEIKDGLILHAFCWGYSEIEENLEAILAAGYTSIQVSPIQQPKDKNASTDISGQWWKLYQPVSLSIGDDTWLGTKEEFKSLCYSAEKYGIKIICDVVTNHLGASSENDFYQLAKEVETYEPTIWNENGLTRDNPYLHQVFANTTDSSASSVTQALLSACPDLNTSDKYVQKRVCALIKECIDCGVDGFRFDAAKHIETPDDEEVASDYWPTIISYVNDYAEKKGQEVFCYGEILNTPGRGSFDSYTKYMSITDNLASAQTRAGVTGKNATGAAVADYNVGTADKAILWAESHDTYLGTSEDTSDISNEDIVKTWALVASRKDSTALYFARPDSMSMGGAAVDTTYKSVTVAEINKFHNLCVGESETLGASGDYAYVVRGTKGIVIVNTNGTTAKSSISDIALPDGEYTDMITGNKFTVSAGTVSGEIGSTGVAVVTQGTTTPTVYADKESQTFEGKTITLNLTLSNATSGTYQLDDYAEVEFTGSPTIRIGGDYNYGDTIKLTLTATDGTKTTKTTYKYTKKQAASSGVYVLLPASTVENAKWTTPVYCYIYDEDTEKASNKVYQNAAWPGEEMKYDEALGCYYVQVQNNSCIESIKGTSTTSPSTFNLANSDKTNVIFSDSAATNGATSSGNQFPFATDKVTKLALGGKSHKMTALNKNNWEITTEVPGLSANVDATEVGKNGIYVPTYKIGDVNNDDSININDVTAVQYHLAGIAPLNCYSVVADVDDNGRINILDATYIQRYIANMSNFANVGGTTEGLGGKVEFDIPTEPVTTEPTTAPAQTYKAYVKTSLTWITDMGCSVFLYDKNSGESYYMAQDMNAYPNVFVADVPKTCTDVIIYRALGVVDNPAESDSAYNLQHATLSETNNCYKWESSGGTVGPYVAEQPPQFELKKLYFDNSVAKWSEVYVYGWGYNLGNTTHAMTNISGTDIWYIELPTAIPDGVETFCFKNTPGGGSSDWDKQTANITVTSPHNCLKLNGKSGSNVTWYTYTE